MTSDKFNNWRFDPRYNDEDSEVECSCGRYAQLRLSRSDKNPFRPFYSCRKKRNKQCGFFLWCDKALPPGHEHVDELNLIRDDCFRLEQKLDKIREEQRNERTLREKEKTELTSQLSALQTEIDKIKNEIKLLKKSSDPDEVISNTEDSELECSSDEDSLSAKYRVPKSPKECDCSCHYRECKCCSESSDEETGDRVEDELNLIRNECIRRQQQIDDIKKERDIKMAVWSREKIALTSQLSTLHAKLDMIKNEKNKLVNGSNLTPPVDKSPNADEDWSREETEVTSQLSTGQAELDKIKNANKMVNKSQSHATPLNKTSNVDEEGAQAIAICSE